MRRWICAVCALMCVGMVTAQQMSWHAASSGSVRVDARTEGGGRLATGTEMLTAALGALTCDGAAVGERWETATSADGWHSLAAGTNVVQTLTLNGPAVRVVGGRLLENTQWGGIIGNPITYVVRHWVVVPKGVTLTIATDAVVKFAPGSGIWVEDGGMVHVVSISPGEGAVFTALADDAEREDTNRDGAASEPENDSWRVVVAPEGSFNDDGQLRTSYGAPMPGWTTVTVGDAVASERDGVVRVPITVPNARQEEYVEWETVHGTARAGEDYEATSGILMWGVGSAATQYATIPLVQDGVKEETEVFFVRLKAAWGLNVARGTATVTLNDSSSQPFEEFVWGKGTSAPVRVDARTTFGGYLVHGEEMLCATDEELACDGIVLTTNMWDSATVTDGPHTLTWGNLSSVVVALNAPEVSVEGGRLTQDAVWERSTTHVVRHWVVVPKGVTLKVTEGTVVKFAPGAGIWVEDGGTLRVEGSETNLVTFTHAADNTFGARVTFSDEVPEMNAYAIVKAPGGTFEDNGWLAARWLDVATFGRVTLHPAAVAADSGEIRIPVTVSGTREAPFTVRWVAEAGTAKPDEDYLLAEGTLSWTGTKEGTKYIVVPTRDNPENTGSCTFFVRVLTACGMNASMASVSATLYRNGAETLMDAAWHAGASASARVDVRVEDSGRLAHGTEALTAALGAPKCDGTAVEGAWETAALADGWHTLSAGTNAVRVLTLNGVGLAVEGGRLAQDTVWGPEAVHVVRHWVVVPKGVTLAVAAGTVAKFAPGAGIWVEDGGTLSITGEAGRDVIFTDLADDSVGGDTDASPSPESLAWNTWRIVGAPGATLSDNGFWQVRHHTMATGFAALTLHDALTERRQGEVWVPLTVSGTRTVPFSVDWSLETGSEDSLTGTLTWGKVAEGTKFIRVPVPEAVSEAGLETLTLRLTAVRGANIHDREAAVTVYDAAPAVEEAILAASWQSADNRPTSPSATVQTLSGDFQSTLILDGQQVFRYSPRWQEGAAEGCVAEILCARTDGKASQTLFRGTEGEEGEFLWKVRNLDDGEYLLTHRVLGPEGKVRASVSRLLRYIATVELHGGLVAEDETWGADRVHLVYADVTVAAGKTLTIEPGAIVKFCDGTGLYSEDYTATTLANGVTFTHFADDTMGGDTNLDGSRSQPKHGAYTLGGHIVVDETSDIRCRHPQTLASLTDGQSMTLESGNVYLVEKSLTFASGSTLTIEPGVIVKFSPGTSLTIAQGATLLAKGMRAAPIILTSLKDDAHGGDTNGDGDATAPQAGDWQTVSVQGTATLTYTHLFYGAPRNESGLIETRGSGTLEMDGCVVAHGMYDGIWNWGGTIRVSNTVVSDVSAATAPYRGSNTFVNCVFAGVNYGVMCWGHWVGGDFINTILWGCGRNWVDTNTAADVASTSRFSHCVFHSPEGYALTEPSIAGKNGNVWGDPCFVDPAGGDFHILPGSAAVDMADGSVAPATDYYGQPRMDVEEAANTGTPSANGAFPDAGIHELMPRTATADIDLAVVSVELPQTGEVGAEVTLAWTVQNIGTKAVDGMWRDTLSLVNESSGQEFRLGTYTVEGYIAPGGAKRTERTLTLPPLAEGAWRVKVVTNAYRDVWEGALTGNNVLLGEMPIQLSVQALALGCTSWGFSSGGWQLWRIPAEAAGYGLTLAAPRGVDVAYSAAPFGEQIATKCVTAFTVSPGLAGGWLYISSPQEAQGVTLTLEPRVGLSALSPSLVEATRQTLTLTLQGTGFTDQAQCSLETETGEAIRADAVVCLSSGILRATFTNVALAEGVHYTPVVEVGAQRARLPEALLATNRVGAEGIEAEISLPSSIRPGRLYEGVLIFRNTSAIAVPAPIFKVTARRGALLSLTADFAQHAESLVLVGIASEGEAGVLAPGASGRLPFFFKGTGTAAPSIGFSTMKPNSTIALNSRFVTAQAYVSAMSRAATALNSTSASPIYDAERISVYAQQMADGVADGRLFARLYDAELKAPAANLALTLVREEDGTSLAVQSDADGVLCVENLAAGHYHLEGETLLSTQPTSFVISGATQVGDLLITPKPFVQGTITEAATKRPIAGATVTDGRREATTDTNGRYRLYHEEAGAFTLTVSAQAAFGLTVSREVSLSPGQTSLTVDFALERGGILRGRVTGDLATLKPDSLNLTSNTQHLLLVVQGDGTFESEPLPSGTYQVDSGDRSRFRVVDAPVTVTLSSGSVSELTLAVTAAPTVSYDGLPCLAPGESLPTRPNRPGINNPQWDFDGDGTIDSTDPTPDLSFPLSGTYTPILTYTDEAGNTHTETLDPVKVLPAINEDDYPYQDNVKDFSGLPGSCVVQQTETYVILEPVDVAFDSLAEDDVLLLPESEMPVLVTGTPTLEEGNLRVPCEPAAPHRVRKIPNTVPDEVIVRSFPKKTWNLVAVDESVTASTEASFFRVTASGGVNASLSVNVSVSLSGKKYWKRTSEFEWTSGYDFLLCSENAIVASAGAPVGATIELLSDKLAKEILIPILGVPGLSFKIKPYPTLTISGEGSFDTAFECGYTLEMRCSTLTGIEVLKNRPSAEKSLSVSRSLEVMGGFGLEAGIVLGLRKANLGLLSVGGSAEFGVRYSNNRPLAEDKPYTATLTPCGRGSFVVRILTIELGGFSLDTFSTTFSSSIDLSVFSGDTNYRSPMPRFYYNSDGAGTVDFIAGSTDPSRENEIISREWNFGDGSIVFPLENHFTHIYCLDPERSDDATAYQVSLRHTIDPPWWTFLPEHTRRQTRLVYPGTFAKEFDPELGLPLGVDGSQMPQSCDPNEMAGPQGVGERRLVKPGEWMTYTVYFENKADATGAAQEVRVTQQLDPRLDWATFELVDVAYRNQIESGLAGKASGFAESALAGTPYKVRTEAAYDATTGAAEWYLRIVDETTPDKWPADAYAGILPPNNAAHEGEGHITYRVKVREDAPDGARIDASASIVFDLNAPIATDPAWWNTVAHVIDTARFATSTLEAQGPEGVARVVIHGGSAEADTAVTLRVLGGTMALGTDYFFPEAITLHWSKGDFSPKTFYIAFDSSSLALGDKTILLGLENAQGLALEADGKTCAITLRRHIPMLTWPEGAEASEALVAWVTEAAARQLIADGALTFAPGTTLATLEQARALGVFPEAEPLPDGGARIAVDVSLGVAELMPEGESLFVTAHIRAIRGLISEPCEFSATFVLRGGSTLEEITWKEVSPRVVGRPTVHSLREATVPLCFPRMAQDSWFFRLRATQ